MERSLYFQHVQKLKDFCQQTGLNFHLNCGGYPVMLTLTPNSYYRQASLFDGAREDGDGENARMTFVLCDGEIVYTATRGATISDANFSKCKGLFEKISRYWTQWVLKNVAQRPGTSLQDLWYDVEGATNDD